MFLRWVLVFAVTLLASCSNSSHDHTFISLEQSFERASAKQRTKSADIVAQMFVTAPKFGRERMAYAHQDALAIMHRCDSVIGLIDAQKNTLAKGNGKLSHAFAQTLKTMLQHALLLHMVTHATYNDVDSTQLYDTLLSRQYDAFTGNTNWLEQHFNGNTAKTQMELSRIKHDIAEAEWLALWELIENVNHGCVLKFDPHMGAAIPLSSFVFEGDRFEANLFFLYRPDTPAYKVQQMTMNGQKLEVVNEIGRYREIARNPGLHSLRGSISVTGPDGQPMEREVKVEYFVMKPLATVETESMRTIFAGRHNALSVAVFGFEPRDVTAQTAKGTLTGSNGKYDLYVTDTGVIPITVFTKVRWTGKTIPADTIFLHAIIHN